MDKRQKIQEEALAAWLNANQRGTLELITGLGKTKIALDAIKLLPINVINLHGNGKILSGI